MRRERSERILWGEERHSEAAEWLSDEGSPQNEKRAQRTYFVGGGATLGSRRGFCSVA